MQHIIEVSKKPERLPFSRRKYSVECRKSFRSLVCHVLTESKDRDPSDYFVR